MLSESLLTRGCICDIADLIPLFLVFFSEVAILKSLLVLNLHIDRVVHHSLTTANKQINIQHHVHQQDKHFYLLLNSDGQFFNIVFAVNFGFFGSFGLELFLFFLINVATDNWVKFTSAPVCLGSLCPENVLVNLHLFIMVLQVPVCHHVVVSLRGDFDLFATNALLLGGFWAFLRWLEMMLLHVDVADNVVVHNGVFARAVVPRLVFWVVWPILKTLQFVFKV